MGEQRFPLRPPPYEIDLTGDGHGHHVAGTPYVFKHGWNPLSGGKTPTHAALKPSTSRVSMFRSRSSSTSVMTDAEGHLFMRNYSKHLDTTVKQLVADDGTDTSTFHVDVSEWKVRWDSAAPAQRAKMTEELEKHLRLVEKVVSAAEEDLVSQHRGVRLEDLKAHDSTLSQSPAGRAIIKMRDLLITDGVAKKLGWVRHQIASHGIETAAHIITGLAAATLVAHLLGTPLLAPVFAHLIEAHVGALTGDRVVEGVMAACVSMHVTKRLLAPLEKLTSRERRIEKAKRRLKNLETQAEKS